MKKTRLSLIAPLLLLLVCMLCAVLTVLTGIRLYSRITESSSSLQDNRTAVSYIRQKIRFLSADGTVEIRQAEGGDALVLTDMENNASYTTWIYLYDGSLCEYYASSQTPFMPAAGTVILPLEDLDLSLDDQILSLTCTSEDGSQMHTLIAVDGEADHD